MATHYSLTPGSSGSAPFAIYNGGDVLHIYTPEGSPLGAAWIADRNPDDVARDWADSHLLTVTEIRRDARNYIPGSRCFDCGDEYFDNEGRPARTGGFRRVYTSKRWHGVIRTDWIRCQPCHEKWTAAPQAGDPGHPRLWQIYHPGAPGTVSTHDTVEEITAELHGLREHDTLHVSWHRR